MRVIDIINKCAFEEKSNFKFWVKMSLDSRKDTVINWEYKDGHVKQVSGWDERFFDYIASDIYDLTDEIIIIEEGIAKDIKELPCLQYIKNDEPDKLTYGSWTMPCNDTERFLSLIINGVIKAIDDMGDRLDATDTNINFLRRDVSKFKKDVHKKFGYAEKTYKDDED